MFSDIAFILCLRIPCGKTVFLCFKVIKFKVKFPLTPEKMGAFVFLQTHLVFFIQAERSKIKRMCCLILELNIYVAEPHSSVSSVADMRTGGHWFDPRLDQYSFRGLMMVMATGFIPLSLLSVVSTMVMWESSQWLGKNIVQSTG